MQTKSLGFTMATVLSLASACSTAPAPSQASHVQAAASDDEAGKAVWQARSVLIIDAMRNISKVGAGLSYAGPGAAEMDKQLQAYDAAFDENLSSIPLFWHPRPIVVIAPNYFDWKALNHDKFAALGDIASPQMKAYDQQVAATNAALAAITDDTERTTARLKALETLCKDLYAVYGSEASITKYNDTSLPVGVLFLPDGPYALWRQGDQTLPNAYYEIANAGYLDFLGKHLIAVEVALHR